MQLPQIVSSKVEGDTVRYQLRIRSELSYFEGHFTGQPILPGVVQVGWAIELASEAFSVTAAAGGLGKIKFNHVIVPGDELDLRLDLDRTRQRLSYIYTRDNERMSSGEIRLQETS